MKLFNLDKPSEMKPTDEPKKRPRGKPFAGKGDIRNNLSGRPKLGNSLAERYRNALAEAESDAKEGDYTNLDAIIDVLISKAKEGDQRAIEYLQERGFGKVPDRLEVNPGKEDDADLSVLDSNEMRFMGYLLSKVHHRPIDLPQRTEWVGTKETYIRLMLVPVEITKEEYEGKLLVALPDVIEAEEVGRNGN